jgi:Photosynthetic reaction centre cytochrome C subunit
MMYTERASGLATLLGFFPSLLLYFCPIMLKTVVLALAASVVLCARSPDITGVWKADLRKSKLNGPPGPPPSNYLVIIERKMAIFNHRTKEQAPQIVETTGVWGEHGEQRSVLIVFANGKPAVLAYRGVPTRLIASFQANAWTVTGEVAGHPDKFTRSYKLSPDGKTLTVDLVADNNGKHSESSLLLIKQPDAASEPLRKPEELAGVHFKNVKTESLKNLPASEFINQMRYFAWSLNRDCEFCHVEHKFDSDDKKEKRTARKMIDMAAAIDQNHFEGHPEVRCFTCHDGHAHPLSHPQFPDEAAAEKAALEKSSNPHP